MPWKPWKSPNLESSLNFKLPQFFRGRISTLPDWSKFFRKHSKTKNSLSSSQIEIQRKSEEIGSMAVSQLYLFWLLLHLRSSTFCTINLMVRNLIYFFKENCYPDIKTPKPRSNRGSNIVTFPLCTKGQLNPTVHFHLILERTKRQKCRSFFLSSFEWLNFLCKETPNVGLLQSLLSIETSSGEWRNVFELNAEQNRNK